MNSRILSLVARRLVVMLTTLLIVSFIVFSATSLLPGDTATILLGQAATPEAVAGLRTAMHLDDPALLRFIRWLFGLVQGDLGTSYANNMAIADLIGPRFINSMKLAGITTIIAVPLALVALGMSLAGYRIKDGLAISYALSTIKLIVQPLVVWGLAWAIGLPPLESKVVVLLASMSVGVNVYLMSQQFNALTGPAATSMLLTTLFSALTTPLFMLLMELAYTSA